MSILYNRNDILSVQLLNTCVPYLSLCGALIIHTIQHKKKSIIDRGRHYCLALLKVIMNIAKSYARYMFNCFIKVPLLEIIRSKSYTLHNSCV